MNHSEKVKSITFIRPNAEFVLNGDELTWLDGIQDQPTQKEIEAGWKAYQTAEKVKIETQAQAKAELLERLGITEDEAKLLLS